MKYKILELIVAGCLQGDKKKMKFTNVLGTKIITSVQGMPKKIAAWSMKTKIIVSISSLVVVAGATTGGVVLYQQLNKPQPVIAEEDTETEAIEVAQNTEEKRMDISIPSFMTCNVVGESVEKDLTLYLKGADDNKIAGVPFQIKLVKPEDAATLQNTLNVISDVNSKIAALAAGETVDITGTVTEVVTTEEDTQKTESTEKKDIKEKDSEKKETETKDSVKDLEEAEKEAIAALAPQEQLLVAKRKAIESYNTVLASVNGNAYTDDDTDGMIYINDIDPGDYIACYVPTSDYDAASYITQVNVKEKVEYKKVENIKEKKEEYTAAAEVAPPVVQVESVMSDTVEFVQAKEEHPTASAVETLAVERGEPYSSEHTYAIDGLATMAVNKSVKIYAGNATLNKVDVTLDSSNVQNLTVSSDSEVSVSGGLTGDHSTFTITANNGAAGKSFDLMFTGTCKDSTETFTITCNVTTVAANTKVKSTDRPNETLYKDKEGKEPVTVANYESGKTYYYAPKYYGWKTFSDNKRYYYDKNGNYVTGVQVIAGSKYTFGDDGVLVTSGYGIDVSKWQGNVDWNQVASVASFAIIRCGFRGQESRGLYEDPYFRQNMKNAQAAGLKVGVYFYSTAMNEVEAVEEASMALDLVSGYKLGLPIYFDFEDNMQRDGLNKDQKNAIMNAFVKTIQNAGRTVGVYSYHNWLSNYVDMNTLPGSVSVWVAQFSNTLSYKGRYDIWQYSSNGSVPGVNGNTDMNISYF